MSAHENSSSVRIPASHMNLSGTLRDQILGLYGAAMVHKIPAEHCRAHVFGRDSEDEIAEKAAGGRPEGATDEQWRAYRGPNHDRIMRCVQGDSFRLSADIARELKISRTTAIRVLQVAEMMGEVVSEYRQIGKARGYFWRAR